MSLLDFVHSWVQALGDGGSGSCGKPEVLEDEALGISGAETSSGVGHKLSTHLKPALGGLLLHDPQ